MNKYTLQFTNNLLEEQYMGHMCQQHIPIFLKTLYIYIFGIGTPFSIISFIEGNLPYGIVGCFTIITTGVFSWVVKFIPGHFNKIVTFLNLMIILLIGAQIYFMDINIQNADGKIVLFYGMTSAQIQYNAIFMAITWNPNFLQVRWAYFCSSLLILLFLYEQIRIKKKNFLMSQGEKEWAHIVKNGLTSPIMTVKYNQKENYITLDIINQNASKQFNIKSSDDFKLFSRNVKVFSKDTAYDQVIEQDMLTQTERKIFRQHTSRQNSGQASPTSENTSFQALPILTLENQIIQLIKQHIISTKLIQERRLSCSLPENRSKKISQSNPIELIQMRQKRQSAYQAQQGQPIVYQYNGIYSPQNEKNLQQKFTVKLSVFQQQTQYQCCIVFEEENSEQKIKRLQNINSKQQANFMHLYLGLWMKLKAILDNQSNPSIVKQYIKLALNQINNVRSHMYLLKKQTLYTRSDQNKESVLKEITEIIYQNFFQFRESIKFTYQNCNNQCIIFSNIPRICQILTNLIENSLRQSFQQTYYKDNICQDEQNSNLNNIPTFYETNNINNIFKDYKCGPSVFFQNRQELSFSEYPQDSHKAIVSPMIELSTRRYSKPDFSMSPRIKMNQVRIKFELIEGENPFSNILKITVKDNGEVAKQTNLEQILYQISSKNQHTDIYKEFKYLGWKVSLNIIGKLGPFFEIFLNPDTSKGVHLHFYIYQNQNILDENQKDIYFKNKQFELDYKKSQQYYFTTLKKINNLQSISQSSLSFSVIPQQNKIPQQDKVNEFELEDNEANEEREVSTLPFNIIDEQVQPIQKGYLSDRFKLEPINMK